MLVNLKVNLRLENDEKHNTWFSNVAIDKEPDIQLHIGQPQNLTMKIKPAK